MINRDEGATQMAEYLPGDVFQINEREGRPGWIGALVMATKIKRWGIQGFVAHVESHQQQNRAYIRLTWDHIDFVGRAPLIPGDVSLVEDSADKCEGDQGSTPWRVDGARGAGGHRYEGLNPSSVIDSEGGGKHG